MLLEQKKYVPTSMIAWIDMFGINEFDLKKVCLKKIVQIKDLKLAETNFKILHNTLPCGDNLLKWKKKNTSNCSICHVRESIAHLICDCVYAQQIWTVFTNVFEIDINLEDIVFGQNMTCEMNLMISLTVYLLYKEWLESSFEDKVRCANVNWRKYHSELKWYLKIYSEIDSMKMHITNIRKFMESIRTEYR